MLDGDGDGDTPKVPRKLPGKEDGPDGGRSPENQDVLSSAPGPSRMSKLRPRTFRMETSDPPERRSEVSETRRRGSGDGDGDAVPAGTDGSKSPSENRPSMDWSEGGPALMGRGGRSIHVSSAVVMAIVGFLERHPSTYI